MRPMSSIDMPAFSRALRTAGTGPIPMMAGSTPETARVCQRILGLTPNSAAFSADIITTAAAPSLILEALPAVTVPSFLNTGVSCASRSTVESSRGPSSRDTTIGSPRRCGTVTEEIW